MVHALKFQPLTLYEYSAVLKRQTLPSSSSLGRFASPPIEGNAVYQPDTLCMMGTENTCVLLHASMRKNRVLYICFCTRVASHVLCREKCISDELRSFLCVKATS